MTDDRRDVALSAFESLATQLPRDNHEESLHRLGDLAPRLTLAGALSSPECVAYLGSTHIGRVALSIGALPVIVPVNYLAIAGTVWFRAPSEGTLLRASVGSVVAFEADGYDDIGSFGWSVLVRGVANEVTDPQKLEAVKSSFVEAWPLVEREAHYIVVPVTMITGQRYAQVV